MPPVSDAHRENLWHREWMERTENAYEWWYFDSRSDDGEWSLVVIFLIGSPFSPYARACELRRNPDPFDYNGVFIALHRRGKLHHYAYAKYPPDHVFATDEAERDHLTLAFGTNSLQEQEDDSFTITLDEENANRRTITARLHFARTGDAAPLGLGTPLGLGASHRDSGAHFWLPVIVGGRCLCEIELHAPSETREPEHIAFAGSAYHDHNWGTLPFSNAFREWRWARADFAPGHAAVLYQTLPAASSDHRQTVLLTCLPGQPLRAEPDHTLRVARTARNAFGFSYPGEIITEWTGGRIVWRFRQRLESTPFYVRALIDAEWHSGAPAAACAPVAGRGFGEALRPRSMGAWLVAHAMRRRIHESGL